MDIVNLDGEKKLLGECYVGGVQLESGEDDSRVYQLPGKIRMEPPLWMKSQRHTACRRTSMKKRIIST